MDDNTVKFTLCAPDVAFPSKAAFSAFGIHSAKQLKETAGTSELLDNPIGTGPYMLEKWNKGDSIIMKANPNYWGEKPKADQLVFRWSKEGAQRLLELQAGTVDGIDNPSPDDFAKIEADTTLKLYPREALNIFYLGMSNTVPPFDNEKVRQAVAMGVDRQRIVDNFYPAGSVVASHFTPCAIPGGCEGEEWYKFDPTAAKALLAEAGFPNGFDTELSYRDVVRSYLPQPGLVAQDIQAQLKENLGINVKINVMESGAFLDTAKTGALPLHLLGWGADYPDQTNFLDYHFGKTASQQFGAGFEDIQALLDKAAKLSDQGERNKLYAEANALIKQHVPMVPVAHGGSGTAFKADVTGAHASPLGERDFLRHGAGRSQAVRLDAERRAAQPLLRRRRRRRVAARMRADQRGAAGLQGRRDCGRAVTGREVHRQRRPDRVDLQPAPGRQVQRWQRLDCQGRGRELCSPVGCREPAAQGAHQRLHLLQLAVRGLPERTAGTIRVNG